MGLFSFTVLAITLKGFRLIEKEYRRIKLIDSYSGS